jgi:hypothetical protein
MNFFETRNHASESCELSMKQKEETNWKLLLRRHLHDL